MQGSAGTDAARAGRDSGVEAFRFLMAILVVVLHTFPAYPPERMPGDAPLWADIGSSFTRVAVPFFFVASGFYLRADRPLGDLIRRPLTRIAPIFAFWLAAYYLASRFIPYVPGEGWGVRSLVTGGPAYHLWFLPALLVSQLLVGVGLRLAGKTWTTLAVLLLAALSLFDVYANSLGLEAFSGPHRLLAAPALVLIGYALRGTPRLRPRLAAALLLLTWSAFAGESLFLSWLSGFAAMAAYDTLLATFAFGTAAFLLARSLDNAGWIARIAPLGRYGLGIYLSHLLFVWIFAALIGVADLGHALATVALAATSALLVAMAIARVPGLGRIAS